MASMDVAMPAQYTCLIWLAAMLEENLYAVKLANAEKTITSP